MRRAALVSSVIAAAVGAFALAGCGGSGGDQSSPAVSTSAGARQAAGSTAGDTYSCTSRNPSFTYTSTIENRLPTAIMLGAREYDCNDWDGTSTPGYAFTGKTIPAGGKRTFTLPAVKYTTRNWTMAILDGSGTSSYGSVRMSLPQTTVDFDRIVVAGSVLAWRERGTCQINQLAATGAPQTPFAEWPDSFTDVALGVVSHKGRVTLASECSY